MANTINTIIKEETKKYLLQNPTMSKNPDQIEQDLLGQIRLAVETENAIRVKAHYSKLKAPEKLEPAQIAELVKQYFPIYAIKTGKDGSDKSNDLLGVYQSNGVNAGIYVTDDETIRALIRQFNYTVNLQQVNECIAAIREDIPRVELCKEKNLIAVNNGIFDYDKKQLLPFTPDHVFMSKSRVDYVQNPVNPVIHNDEDGTDWDVESWMKELSDDPEIVNLLWEILGAIIRPLVPWNKSAWFYSESGNNGKGTLCELMRQLCGSESYASIPLSDMGKDFALEPLIRASAIIVDENDVGTFIDKAANLKAIITGDAISVNRKFKTIISFMYRGFMVQCLNEMPKVKDKSDSFYRRQLFIPFTKCFTGKERKYIKNDYLHRKDVLEYVLWRVLNMNYYNLSEPESCKQALAEYREYNDPVRQFAQDILEEARWTLLPKTLLYQAFHTWTKKNNPAGKDKIMGRNTFFNEFQKVLKDFPEWAWADKKDDCDKKIKGEGRMEVYEPMLETYELTDWMNPKYAHKFMATTEEKCEPAEGQYKTMYYRGAYKV